MCGIALSVNYPKVDVILNHQHKRGPDRAGYLRFSNIEIGHNRLSIIDLENGSQPIYNDNFYLTYNGEWYNFKDHYPNETSDTIALFKSLSTKGIEQTLKDINGMFAIAFYDKLQNKVYCAVDRFGQKPLYYYQEHEKFILASNPAAIVETKDKWNLNKEAINSYWLLGSVFGEDSIWDGIKKLNGSELLELDLNTNKLKKTTYWQPSYIENAEKIIEDLVYDSIEKVKISDVPICIFLSGGIDSSLVASRFKNGNAVHLNSPELPYAQEAANKFSINLIKCNPNNLNVERDLTDYVKQSGEPTMSGIIPYITAKEVSKHFKVAITANGADELFFGYDRTHDVIQDGQMKHIFRTLGHRNNIPCNTQFNKNPFHGRMLELNSYVQFDLNKTLDFASMCHSLEVRSPFLDHRLVETALSIPEQVHKKNGNKTILKNILKKQGFNNEFINRPKLGFSLHSTPPDLDKWKQISWTWCIKEGWLNIKGKQLNGRDSAYLQMSALGFYFWYKTWEHKIF